LEISISKLSERKIPTIDEFSKASNTQDVKRFIDSCKKRDENLAGFILECCRIFIDDFEFDIEGSTKFVKSVDRYANMTIKEQHFKSPIEIVLDFLLKRQENLPDLSKAKTSLPTNLECEKYFEKQKNEQNPYYGTIQYGFS